MSSGSATPKEVLTERLAELRDSVLEPSENVLAQQMGDHGQAVVITGLRIMILKTGLSATGSIDGQNVTALPFAEIDSVNLRRGPMGAIIQIAGKQISAESTTRPPENIAVFSGEQKVRKLESLVEKLISASGVKVNRVDCDTMAECTETDAPEAIKLESDQATAENVSDSGAQIQKKKPRSVKAQPAVKASDKEKSSEATASSEPLQPQTAAPADSVEAAEEIIKSVSKQIQTDITTPKKPAKPVRHKSLADEMFEELTEEAKAPAEPKTSEPVISEPRVPRARPAVRVDISEKPSPAFSLAAREAEAVAVPRENLAQEAVEKQQILQHGPNPKLSSYMKKHNSKTGPIAIAVVLLALMVVGGLAIVGRTNLAQTQMQAENGSSRDVAALRAKLQSVDKFRSRISSLMAKSNLDARRMQQALDARDAGGIRQTVSVSNHEEVIKGLEGLVPPRGLRVTQNMLEDAVNERKAVATTISNALTGASIVDPSQSSKRLKEADTLVQKAYGQMQALERSINNQIQR